MVSNYDFGGWATKNDLRCSDGRTIRRNAFKDCDGRVVPLVWNHQHNQPENVLGHALLENREEGVYAYCTFNDTEKGVTAKSLVAHGDVDSLSIYANQLKQNGGDVLHGIIREVSLVLAGANPGAMIDLVMAHSDDAEGEVWIYADEKIIMHGDETMAEEKKAPEAEAGGETVEEVFNTLTDLQKNAVYILVQEAVNQAKGGDSAAHSDEDPEVLEHADEDPEALEHADGESDESGETVQDVFNTLSEKQKNVVYALIGQALEDADNGKNEGENNMKHNVFEDTPDENTLSHSEMQAIFADAQRDGSLKAAVLAHGIEDIEYLFPEATNLNKVPEFINQKTGWVSKVMGAVHHTPFSRIRSTFADITEPDARAKGYLKGNRKMEEVFGLAKRYTSPCTVYKKQKLDRDDIIDITDFDVVAWLKTEMRGKMEEELARAYLVGDGRSTASEDKISEVNIRPIWKDDDLFTIKSVLPVAATASLADKAAALIDHAIRSRIPYRGSGTPTCYTSEEMLAEMLLLRDEMGHRLYNSESDLATAMRVKEIVTIPFFDDLTRIVNGSTHKLEALIVNLADYNVGADKGGALNMFDDFDIDYNQYKYLMETRCSAALVKAFSAIAIESVQEIGLTTDPVDPTVDLLGKTAGELQTGVVVNDNFIVGTLKYVSDYTGFSGDPEEQKGNFLALKFNTVAGSTTTVEVLGGKHGPVTLDSDKMAVLQIANKNTQKVKVVSTKNGESVTKIYGLTAMKLIAAE